jgi:hypothetical protein
MRDHFFLFFFLISYLFIYFSAKSDHPTKTHFKQLQIAVVATTKRTAPNLNQKLASQAAPDLHRLAAGSRRRGRAGARRAE